MKKIVSSAFFFLCLPLVSTASDQKDARVISILEKCSPPAHKPLIARIIAVESGGNPFAININGKKPKWFYKPKTIQEARVLVINLWKHKINFDIGLTQINSQHFMNGREFSKRGFKVEDALDPCINIKMSAYLVSEAYRRSNSLYSALSIYNTGSVTLGLKNGYVQKIIAN